MGPTNQALVRLFQADQKYRESQARYDAAARDVRIQERKVRDLSAALQVSQARLKEQQTKAAGGELDIKTREAHIEKLREQQQTAKNNKEYQTFLVEINTEKVDKNKAEDELLKLMGEVEQLQQGVAQASALVQAETQKLDQIRRQITTRLESLKVDVDQCQPDRDEAAAAVPPRVREMFERLAERFDGEAMAAIEKPDRRVEEYICSACNMSMAVDLYNRLHTRDEPMTCPSCRRLLYIPDDLPPEEAINQRKKTKKLEEKEPAKSEQAPVVTPDASAQPSAAQPAAEEQTGL